MAAAKTPPFIICPSCGAKNAPSAPGSRCASCGSAMDALGQPARDAVGRKGRARQGGFSFVWCAIALVVQSVLDFEGSNGMIVAIPVWFVGGMLLGMISPGRTYAEPVIASFLVLIPTVLYLWRGQTVRTMPFFMYAILGLIGVLFTLIGAYLGERIQMGPPPKPAD
jgi:hypothetical protein